MANVVVTGDTSGSVTLAAPAVAGSTTITLPNTTGTMALTSQIVASSGELIRAPQILTSGTSYTTPSNCTKIYVEAQGGGGNSGNATRTVGTVNSGGGGSGAYCAKYFTVTANTAYSYTIGAATGNTTFTVGATTITAGGGASSAAVTDNNSGPGGAGGTATNGDLNINGNPGSYGQGTNGIFSGASSMFGGGGLTPLTTNSSGGNGTGYGSGAGGTNRSTNGTTTGTSVGAQGFIRIWEYT